MPVRKPAAPDNGTNSSKEVPQPAAETMTSTIAVMMKPVQPALREDPALAEGGMPQLFADKETDEVNLPDSDISDEEELEDEETVAVMEAGAATLIVTKHAAASGLENSKTFAPIGFSVIRDKKTGLRHWSRDGVAPVCPPLSKNPFRNFVASNFAKTESHGDRLCGNCVTTAEKEFGIEDGADYQHGK